MIRDYTIHLRVNAPSVTDLDRLDDDARDVVDASSAREAIETGLRYAYSYTPARFDIEVANFYVVSNVAPPGAIEQEDE